MEAKSAKVAREEGRGEKKAPKVLQIQRSRKQNAERQCSLNLSQKKREKNRSTENGRLGEDEDHVQTTALTAHQPLVFRLRSSFDFASNSTCISLLIRSSPLLSLSGLGTVRARVCVRSCFHTEAISAAATALPEARVW